MKYTSWKQFKPKWVKALRSGRYTQGNGKLVNNNDEFCCLGVAANLLIEAGHNGKWTKDVFDNWAFGTDANHDVGTLSSTCAPAWLRKKLCSNPEGHTISDFEEVLIEKNDGGKSFEHIADYIQKNM